jgi:DNA-binding CsgD family transcriptional regulator/PAS domain-containing protein
VRAAKVRLGRRTQSLDVGHLLGVVGTIYEAALRPEAFSDSLKQIADILHAGQGSFILEDRNEGKIISSALSGLSAVDIVEYERDWMALDLGLHQLLPEMPAGSILTDSDWPRNQMDIYNGFFRPRQMDHSINSLLINDGSQLGLITFHRSRSRGPFESQDRNFLGMVLPHLARAVTIRGHLLDAVYQGRATIEALDRLPTGVLLLDRGGRPIHMNRVAREILDASDGLSLRRDGLAAASQRETLELRRLIREASATAAGTGLCSGGFLTLRRPSLRRSLTVLVSPLHAQPLAGLERPAAALFLMDPERKSVVPLQALQRVHDLTPAEARLAQLLLNGLTTEEAALSLRTSVHTARTHLKHLLSKVGVRRQSELIAVLLRGVAAIS